jgi:hypothetical protein
MSAGANDGAYAGLGTYQSGGGGGGLHSLVHTLRDQFGSHCAELTPGAAIITAAIETSATAVTRATRQRAKLVIVGLPGGPVLDHCVLQLMSKAKGQRAKTPSDLLG